MTHRVRFVVVFLALAASVLVALFVARRVREELELHSLRTGHRAARVLSARWLADRAVRRAVPVLVEVLCDEIRQLEEDDPWPASEVPDDLAVPLEELLTPSDGSLLIDLLRRDHPPLRLWAVRALDRLDPKSDDAISALAQASVDEDWEVARAASDALVSIGQRAAPELVRALPIDLDWYQSFGFDWTYRTLARLGPNAKAARPLLEERLESFVRSVPGEQRYLVEPSWLFGRDHRLLLIPLSDDPALDFVAPVVAELSMLADTIDVPPLAGAIPARSFRHPLTLNFARYRWCGSIRTLRKLFRPSSDSSLKSQ